MPNYSVKATALSPVHIGSGETLSHKSDYVTGIVDGVQCVGVVDPEKVLSIISERDLDSWVASIERGESTDSFIGKLSEGITMEKYCNRILDQMCDRCRDDIRSFMYDGFGHPYIPGSSIKGAIRSAVIGTIGTNQKITDDIRPEKKKRAAEGVEAKLFGKSPNESVFRFLKVGDAIIRDANLAVIDACHINERNTGSYFDSGKHQLLEVLYTEDSAEFDINLDLEYYGKCNTKVPHLPLELNSIDALFSAINTHTQRLLDDELRIWKPMAESAHEGSDWVEAYINSISEILEKAKACKPGKECVLRLGAGSGWRFMTGAWPEKSVKFDDVIDASRPGNRNKYAEYRFPKTRRIDKDGYILGFMKLSLV